MTSITHTYFFGRLNLAGMWEDKRKFIYDSLIADVLVARREFKYGLFDIEDLNIEEGIFVFGHLVKYKPLLEGEIVDEDKHGLVESGLLHGVVAKSEFYLHYRTGIVAYRPISNRISDNQFREIVAALIEAGHHNLLVNAEIQSIDEELVIDEAFNKFRSINRITIDLHPSNPSNQNVYKNLDERIKKIQARRYKQTIEATDRGFNREALREDDAYRGLIMAADGYGRGSIQGETDEGRRITINTDDSPVTKEIAPSESPNEVLYQLMPTFKRIWERMAK